MESLWSKKNKITVTDRGKLPNETEVAVIGAGMAGLLTAYKLQSKGKNVIVLEASKTASGQTKNTTAKITSQHSLIYAHLIAKKGYDLARQYADANQGAINEYRQIIQDNNIECSFEEKNAYIYSLSKSEELRREAEAAQSLGLPAEFVENTALPFETAGAVKFSGQAQFDPLSFIAGISDKLNIYENTRVLKIGKNEVETENGTVKAENIVIASHFPFVNFPGYYFARMHQQRSYVLCLKNAADVNGMYLGIDSNAFSFRNSGDLLLFGGSAHRTGENRKGGRYEYLRTMAKQWYPQSEEVCCWSAQDCITADKVPYIGRFSSAMPNVYIATGFNKWGMTGSMVSARIISEMICGKGGIEVFSPQRISAEDVSQLVKDGAMSVKGLAKEAFFIPAAKLCDLSKDSGGVVEHNGKKYGVYKDKNGRAYIVDTRCPHLGCQLEFNPDEKTWDCPCHGSRFDYKGNLISSPAQTNISVDTEEGK